MLYCDFVKICYVFVLLAVSKTISSQNTSITIPLRNTTTLNNKELFGDFITINGTSTIQVNLKNANSKLSPYIIFQVHSHIYNITLYNNSLIRGSYISGTNVGLYSDLKRTLDTFYILNENEIALKLYISVHGYRSYDPIPGGCNMEFPVDISPFMYADYNKDYINVDAAPAKDPKDIYCLSVGSRAKVTFYRMYLPEKNFDSDLYFNGIKSMITMDKIKENGVEVPQGSLPTFMRRMLSAYPGTGSIYVAVAYNKDNSSIYSVYVPAYTYACSPTDENGCQVLDDITSQFLCAALFFLGLFTCYFGHRFFKTEMFVVGMLAGVIVTFITISLISDLNRPALLGVSVLSGTYFGAIWLLFWWFYGIPFIAVLLTILHLGFMTSAIIYYQLPGGLVLLETDMSFWSLFIAIMISMSLAVSSATFLANIMCCAILGAYATVFSVDHYIGSNLKYIIINTVRRAVVRKFNYVVVSPPFQWRDAIATLLWVFLATSGFIFQHYHNRGRPPFPPPPRSISPNLGPPRYGATNITRRRSDYEALVNGADTSRPQSTVRPESVVQTFDERSPLI